MVEYVPDMHIVERSSRSVRILADWCNGSTSDSDSENIGSIPVLAVKSIRKKEVKIDETIRLPARSRKEKLNLHQWRNKEYAACLNRAEEISREFKSLLVHFRSVSEFGRRG